MEIVHHRQEILNAMESNASGNNNFVIKVISKENVKGKAPLLKKIWKK